MHSFDVQYKENLRKIKEYGEPRRDRTGVGTTSLFGLCSHEIDLRDGFPLSSLKKVHFHSIKVEGEWFLSGDTNVRFLKANNVRIWDEWVLPETAEYRMLMWGERLRMMNEAQWQNFDEVTALMREDGRGDSFVLNKQSEILDNYGIPQKVLVAGELGPVYGDQWRNWEDTRIINANNIYDKEKAARLNALGFEYTGFEDASRIVITRRIDQIARIEKQINDERAFHRGELEHHSAGRRIILNGWNVAKIDEMALPPCHTLAQWSVSSQTDENGKHYLDCLLFQRSVH